MMRDSLIVVVLCSVGLVVAGLFTGSPGRASADDDLLFSKVRLFVEFNDTDQDVGVQVLIDGEPWRRLRAFRPDGKKILDLKTKRGLEQQGLSEFFFESSEPTLDEVSLEEFLDRFPAGEYEFEGVTIEGEDIEGETILSHVIPVGPEIVAPESPCDELPVVDPDDFVIEWEPVTDTIHGSPDDLEIVGYQVVVAQEEPLRTFSIDLPASATSVTVPAEFFTQPDTVHKFEVLAVDVSGNQTITEMEFLTQP